MDVQDKQIRLAVVGMARERLELLPALFNDPQVEIRWVYAKDSDSAIAHLASLFSFPVRSDLPALGAMTDIDFVIQAENGGPVVDPTVRNGVRLLSDVTLAACRRADGFAWDQVVVETAPKKIIDPPVEAIPDPTPQPQGWVPGMTCSPERQMPEDLPAWFPRLIDPKRLGAWFCDRIDVTLEMPLPSIIVLTRGNRIFGIYDALGKPGPQLLRSVRRFFRLICTPDFFSANSHITNGHPVEGPFDLSSLGQKQLFECGFSGSGAQVYRMPLEGKIDSWLLYIDSVERTSQQASDLVSPQAVRETLARHRMTVEVLARLTIQVEQAKQWRLLRSMGKRLHLSSRALEEKLEFDDRSRSERADD
jgi:hypothetical protein